VTRRRRKRRSILVPLLALAASAAAGYLVLRRGAEPPRAVETTPKVPTPAPTRPRTRPAATPRRSALPSDFESAGGEPRAALALVVDDVGFDADALRRLGDLDGPLSLAVIPSAPFAHEAAALAARKKWDLLVHLPMEGASGSPAESGAIGPADDDGTIAARVAHAIDAVPGASGLNNHQGSRATSDVRVVRAMLEVVGARGLFFLDSRTTAATVAETEARKLGIPTVARDVFLDDAAAEAASPGGKEAALEKAWADARSVASRKGSCVVIAHPRKETLGFLAAHLARGAPPFRRVRVSQLAD
jgi:polysaccharide deacetylase 2 family uncharacterized protein YibQ